MQKSELLRVVLFSISLCLLVIMFAGASTAQSEDLRAENAVDIQTEVPVSGTVINHVGSFEQDEDIRATIVGPQNEYNISLYNSSEEAVANSTAVTGDFSLDTAGSLTPGSYLLQVTDTPFDPAAAIVVSGYRIDVAQSTASNQDELVLNTTVTETATTGAPNSVEAIVWDSDTEKRVQLTRQSDFDSSAKYNGTASIGEFEDGSYGLYVVATGDEQYQGENELLAVEEVIDGRPNYALPEDNTDSDSDSTDTTDDSTGNNGGTETGQESNNEPDTIEPNIDVGQDEDSDTADDTESEDSNGESSGDDTQEVNPNDDSSGDDTQEVNPNGESTNDETPLSVTLSVISLLIVSVMMNRRAN